MANTETLASLIQNIASAIREKTQKTDLLTLQQMPSEILSISGGGDLTFDQVIARNYEDLNITELNIILKGSVIASNQLEILNSLLLCNSTFHDLYIGSLIINPSQADPQYSSFIYKSTLNSLTIDNFTLTNYMPSNRLALIFDNPDIVQAPYPSLRINNIKGSNKFYLNFSQPVKCLFLNLQNMQNKVSLNNINRIGKLILTNSTDSNFPLEKNAAANIEQVFCSSETSPEFQSKVENVFSNVTFISNEECENLWATEITVQP